MGKSLAPVLLAATLALAGVLWFTQRGPRDVSEVAAPGAAPTSATPQAAPDLAQPVRVDGEQRAELEAQPAEVAPAAPRAMERVGRILESKDEAETGSIHVTVVSTQGEPVPGAALQVIRAPIVPSAPDYRGMPTDARGSTVIFRLALGSVRVAAQVEELAPGISETVRLTAAQPRAEVVITLAGGGSVEGELMDIHGEPAAGTELLIQLRAWPGQVGGAPTDMQWTVAGDDGSFRFDHLLPGAYLLYTEARGSNRTIVPNQMVELKVLEGQTTVAVFEDLQRSHVQVSGLVLRDDTPLGGVHVTVHWADKSRDPVRRNARTDASGHFEITLNEGGDYKFEVSESLIWGRVIQMATVPAVPIHELVIAYSTGRISGRVLGPDGLPEPGVGIRALGRVEDAVGGSTDFRTTSGANGVYEFPHLLAATYKIMAGRRWLVSVPQPGADPYLGGTEVSGLHLEPGDDLTAVDLHLAAAAALEVRVTDREGNPVTAAVVQCSRPKDRSHREMTAARSDATGLCRIPGLAPGDWRIRAFWGGEISAWAKVSMIANETAHTGLVLMPGTMVTIEVQDGGSSAERCYFYIKDSEGFILTSWVSKDRAKVLGPLAPGTYKVEAQLGSSGPRAEKTISVADEPTQTVQLTLQ